MKKIIIAALLTLSFNAFATSILPTTNNNSADAVAIAGATSNASAASNAAAQNNTDVKQNTNVDVKVGQTTSVGVGQMATTGNQAVNISSSSPSKVTYRYAPDISLGSLHPTSPCMGSSNVGGSGVGFSFGVGTSWTDDECGIRETSRSFMGLGLIDDALAIMCSSKYAKAAPACNK